MGLFSKFQVHLYNPDNDNLTAGQWQNNFNTLLIGFSESNVLDLVEFLADLNSNAQIYLYIQSHGLDDDQQEFGDSQGTALTPHTVNHNNPGWLPSAVKHFRDNEIPGIADSADWRLLDDSQQLIYGDGGVTLVLDPGSSTYRTFLADITYKLIRTLPHNAGVFLDNTNAYSGTFTATRKDTDEYGNYKSTPWVNVMAGLCQAMTDAMNAQGLLATGNVQAESDQYDDFQTVSDALDGVMLEFWASNSGENIRTGADWLEYFNRALYLGATNKVSFLICPEDGSSPNATKQAAIMACVGLVIAPKTTFRPYGNYGDAYALTSADDLDNLGGPITCAYETGTAGVWRRDFQNGNVQFNANTGAGTITQTVGGTYTPNTYAPLTAKVLDRTDAIGDYVSFYVYADALGDETLTYSITNAPPGISIDEDTGEIYGRIRHTANASYTPTITVTATNGSGSVDNDQDIAWAISDGIGSETYVTRVNCGGAEYDAGDGTVWAADSAYHDSADTDSVTTNTGNTYDGTVPDHWPDVATVRDYYRFDVSGSGNQIPYDITVDSATPVFVRVAIPGHASSGDYDILINGVSAGTVSPTTIGAGNIGVYEFTNSDSGYTPTGSGPYEVRVQAGDGEAVTARIVAIEVYREASQPSGVNPTLIDPGNKTVTRGVAVDFPLVAYDWNSNGVTLSATGLPTGLSITDNDSIQGTTTVSPGDYNVTLTVTDDSVGSFTEDVEITITVVNAQAPTVTSIAEQSGVVGDTGTLNVSASSLDSGTLSYAASGLPQGKSINASTGAITGKLLTNTSAQQRHQVTITVTNTTANGTANTQISFDWWVKPGDPIVRSACGQGGSHTITGDGSTNWTLDTDSSATHRASDSSSKTERQLMRGDTVPPWVPASVQGIYRYGDTMVYTLPAGGTAPVIVNAILGGFDIEQYTDITANGTTICDDFSAYDDADGGYGLTVMKSAVVTPNGSNNVVITIQQGASGGTEHIYGLELLEYITAETPVPSTSDQNDYLGNASASADFGGVSVSDGGTVTYSATGLPTGLTIDEETGEVTGTPTQAGAFTPTLTIHNTKSDGGYATASEQFNWTITDSDPTFDDPGPLAATEGEAFSYDFSNDTASTSTATIVSHQIVSGDTPPFSMNTGTGVLSGTTPADSAGEYTFTMRVIDSYGQTADREVTLTVSAAEGGGGDGGINLIVSSPFYNASRIKSGRRR